MSKTQIPRRITHEKRLGRKAEAHEFDYNRDYRKLDLRKTPELYRVGRAEEGVLLVEPYKSEILPHWRFKTAAIARESAKAIEDLFHDYKRQKDFVGMDMARKFLQMGFTRSRRYANHKSGQKYDKDLNIKPFENDAEKARAAEVFKKVWHRVERDPLYADLKLHWRYAFG